MQKITMRGVMLAAGFVLGSAALNAQGVTSLEGQVYTPVQLVDGGKYVIKNVGSNEGRQGWMAACASTWITKTMKPRA